MKIEDCLKSVWANINEVRAEVIVVDNGSTDGSPEMVAERFPDTRLVLNPDNRGFAAANNQGFMLASGRYVLLLNSDTLVHGDVLSRSINYLASHPWVGMMGCKVLNGDGTLRLKASDGSTHTVGEVPAGSYEMLITFEGETERGRGTVVVREGQTTTIECNARFGRCKTR